MKHSKNIITGFNFDEHHSIGLPKFFEMPLNRESWKEKRESRITNMNKKNINVFSMMVAITHNFKQNKINLILFAEMKSAHIFIWMTLWMITGVSMTQAEVQPELHKASDVTSVNYGITFEYKDSVYLATDAWQHVFRIELPEHQHIPAAYKLEPHEPHQCESTCEINQFIREMLHEYDIRNFNLLHNIYKIFPNIDIGNKNEFKRGLKDFVGVIGHQLFGFSTDAELQQLQNNIESILTGSTDVTTTLNSQIKNLFSSLKITNERIDSAMKTKKILFDKFGSFARVRNKTLGQYT